MLRRALARPLVRFLTIALSFLFFETIRASLLVHPRIHEDLLAAGVDGVPADLFDMRPAMAAIWVLWSTVVVICIWIVSEHYRKTEMMTWPATLQAGTLVWAAVFVANWLPFLGFGLVEADLLFVALPSAWIELIFLSAMAIAWPNGQETNPALT